MQIRYARNFGVVRKVMGKFSLIEIAIVAAVLALLAAVFAISSQV